MNLVCVPYHDWRKIENEGARTRDSHLISHFVKSKDVERVLVINRPTSYPEILAGKKKILLSGSIIFAKGNLRLYKISEKLFVIDYITLDIVSPFLKKRLWLFQSFKYNRLIAFFKECLQFLDMQDFCVFTNNIFSLPFIEAIKHDKVVFDAYDNLIFFPDNQAIKDKLIQSYNKFVTVANFWTTNSTKNQKYYEDEYSCSKCYLVKNGVDIEVFERKYERPADMQNINRPVIGFGGKITHLFDVALFNYCVDEHPDKDFVIVGQILDAGVFNKISKKSNVHYLGDKHYSQYSSYVSSFDVGIIPYVTNHLESGVDSIKVYEYIAAGINAVGTLGGGIPDLADYVFVSNDKYEFAQNITKALNNRLLVKLPMQHTWEYKCQQIVSYIRLHLLQKENYVN